MPTGSDFSNVQLSGDNTFQSSSKMSGDPKELLAGSTDCILEHGDLVAAYGLNMPVATLGQHPWLRDGLANATEDEPGAMEPVPGKKMPGKDT